MKNQSTFFVMSTILLLACASAFANTETRSVDTTTTISASPEEVLQAFLKDDDLKAWWKVSRSLVEPRPGGLWSITWDDWGGGKNATRLDRSHQRDNAESIGGW